MIKRHLPSPAPPDGISFATKKPNGNLENCFFDPYEPGFIVKRVIDAKIRLAPTLTDQIPWPVLVAPVQDDPANVLDRQEPNETVDRPICVIEYPAPVGSGWAAPTSTKIDRDSGYVINTILKSMVGLLCGVVLLGCGWLVISMVLIKAL